MSNSLQHFSPDSEKTKEHLNANQRNDVPADDRQSKTSADAATDSHPRILSSKFRMETPNTDLFSLFRPTMDRFTNKTAVIELFGDGRSLTFHELRLWSEAVAGQFYQHGLRKHRNDKVAIYSPNCIEVELVFLAAQRIGVTLVSVNYLSTAGELQYCLEITGAAALVAAECVIDNAKKAASSTSSIHTIFSIGACSGAIPLAGPARHGSNTDSRLPLVTSPSPPEIETLSINPATDAAFIQFSSGTTGMPKAVTVSHRNMASIQTAFQHESFKNNSDYRMVYQPMSHIFGLGVTCETLFVGATLLLQSKFDLHEYLSAVVKFKVPLLHIVPPIAVMMGKTDLSRYDLSAVHTVVVASAPLSATVEAQLKASVGNPKLQIAQAYGLTETAGLITMAPFGLSVDRLREAYNIPCPTPPGSCGLLLVNTEAKVVNMETGEVLGPNTDGEIMARGPQIMLGYFNNASATSATIDADGWLHTGDIGHYDENGYFFIVDRAKELIKYKGFQVAPAELEGLILQHPGVYDVGVIGIPDELCGELPQAWVVRKADATALVENDVIEWTAARCAPYKRLRGGVRFVNVIPRSPTGKVLRRLMRQNASLSKL